MNVRTNSNSSCLNIIQPVRKSVPAGFSVFKTGETPEVFLYLESGELEAVTIDQSGKEQVLFKVQEKEVVGVPTLIEKEPLAYDIKASADSTYLQIDEECLASALKASPVWLLAATRQIVLHSKRAKADIKKTLCKNKSRALAAFLCMQAEVKIANGEVAIFKDAKELLRECSWLSRIPQKDLVDELISLERRHFLMRQENSIGIQNPELLKAYVDYQNSLEYGDDFAPFHLNLTEKRCLFCIARQPSDTVLEASVWLSLLKGNDKFATVAEIIMLTNFGILEKTEFGLLAINREKVNWFMMCLKHEADIRGAI